MSERVFIPTGRALDGMAVMSGSPEWMSVTFIVPGLKTWGGWNLRPDQLAELGRALVAFAEAKPDAP